MNKENKNLLFFGYGLAIILSIIGVRLWVKFGLSPIKIVLLTIAALFFFITLIKVELLKPVYTRWMKAAHFIGSVVTVILLSFIFYTLFLITGIIMRLLKKDLLDRNIEPEAKSYWKEKKRVDSVSQNYKQQF